MKDEKIVQLELMIHKMRAEAQRCEEIKEEKMKDIDNLKRAI